MIVVRPAPDLTVAELYEVWRIRDVVFAVEQRCDEADVDDVDLRDDCTHLWVADEAGRFKTYLRTYLSDGVRRVGRVATTKDARGQGLAGELLDEVLRLWGDSEIALNAQAHPRDWYAGFGFAVSGPNFVEAGIDHVPMRRPAS